MSKPLAWKRAFYAMGQRDKSRGVKAQKFIRELPLGHLARMAYSNGWSGW